MDFHSDGTGDHLSKFNMPGNKFLDGHVRKLSMSVILNDNFEGGAFEFATYGKEECVVTPIEATAGSIMFFHLLWNTELHRYKRYSLFISDWFLGPPFV